MAFLIHSEDGRVRICTASAEAAQRHVEMLQHAGISVKIGNLNGTQLGSPRLEPVELLKATRLKFAKAA